MAELAVETRGLYKRFGAQLAVADLTIAIPHGEIFGFLGPNGAGKTTSVKILLGLVPPTGGAGQLLGRPIGDAAARAKVGFLPEHFRFHDCLTGREFLRLHGRLYGMHGRALEARIDELLARMDLLDAAERALKGYSKGMVQRVGLAQALLNDPDLVFLDEPTSGLDPLGRRLVRDILRELRERGTTVFLNSHLLGEVEATCDRVMFVKQGRTLQELSLRGGASDLLVELRLDRAGVSLAADLAAFGRDVSVAENRVTLRMDGEERLPELTRWLVERGVGVYGVHGRRPTLEQVFLEVMGDDQRPG